MKKFEEKEWFMIGGFIISIGYITSALILPSNEGLNKILLILTSIYFLCFVRRFRAGGQKSEEEKSDEKKIEDNEDE